MSEGLKTTVLRERPTSGKPPPRAGALPVVPRDAYERGALVAEGGMGRIYRARDRRLGRAVAIKELLSEDAWLRRRFIREALITSRLQHPSIVAVYEAGQWPDGAAFYAMKLVEGRTLADLLEETSTIDDRLVLLRHLSVSAEAIAYAHDKRIIHRDLKPENVLIGPFGETVIIDWGLVKDLDDDDDPDDARPTELTRAYRSVRDGRLTSAGAVVGTPEYMSPEQALGEPVDQRTDVYALGVMLYELLTGAQPFTGETAGEILGKLLDGPPSPPESRCKEVPRELAAIASKAMAREPAARYPSAKEFAAELRRFEAGQIVLAHRYGSRERVLRFIRRNAQLLVVLGAASLALVLLTGLAVNRVIAERNRATDERNRATAAEQQALAWSDRLVLLNARNELARDPNKALAWLKELSPGFRAWGEVRLIAAEARSRGLSLALRGHAGPVSEGRFSPDGAWVVTVGDDHTARAWDTSTWESRALEGHEDEVWKARFSSDGERVATFGAGPRVIVWDVGAWTRRAAFEGHREPVWDGAWAGGDRYLLVVSRGAGYTLHELASGRSHALSRSSRRHVGLAVSQDGRTIAYPDGDHIVARALDDERGPLEQQLADPEGALELGGELGSVVYAMALSPDGTQLAAGLDDGEIRLWPLERGATSRTLGEHAGGARSVAFTRDGASVLSSGADGVVRQFSIQSRRESVIGQLDTSIARPFAFDGQRIAVAGGDGLIHTWDVETHKHRAYYGLDNNPLSVNLAPNGAGVIATDFEGGVRVWTELTPDGELLARGPQRARWSALSPSGEEVAFVDRRGRPRVYNLSEDSSQTLGRQRLRELDGGRWSPGGARLALWSRDGVVELLRADDQAARRFTVDTLTALAWRGDDAVITA
ncbi:MAG: protein kinase, partial [Myxococcales bacterium]|nr:protein kinase [Myxococcales bacterium]